VGGIASLAQFEVPIYTPIFACLTSATSVETVQNRFYNYSLSTSGDSMWLGAAISSFLPMKHWGMKRYPRFHAVDFLQSTDIILQWMTGIIQAYLNDPQAIIATNSAFARSGKDTSRNAPSMPPNPYMPVCPLTVQEVQLLLRNVLMSAFKQTQAGVQSLYPREPESATDNQFVPFVSCASTCPITALDMVLPVPFLENIRALVARHVEVGEGKDFLYFVPILGQYVLDEIDPEDYTATIPSSQVTYQVFTTASVRELRTVDAKGVEVSVPLVEAPISMVDGSSAASPTNLVFINDPQQLKTLTAIWNEFLASVNVGSFSCQTSQLGTELGITALCSVSMTRHWVPINLTLSPKRKISREERGREVDVRVERRKNLSSTVYAQRQVVADSSQGPIMADAYEQILGTWQLPVMLAQSGANTNDQTLYQRTQLIMGEPYGVVTTAGSTGQIMSTMNSTYAMKMVRSRDAPPTEWDRLFQTLAASGRGGMLSGLLADAAGAIFGQGVGSVASTIASVLPF